MSLVGVYPSLPNFIAPAAVTSPREWRGCALRVPAGGGSGTGRRAPALGGEGQRGSGTAGWVAFSLPEMDFLPPERSGLACRRLPGSAQLLHTLFCLRSVRNTLVLPSACPAGRDPGSALLRRGLPRAATPVPLPTRRVVPLPLFSRELGFP